MKKLWEKLHWQQVVTLAIFAVSIVFLIRSIPHEVWTKLPPEFYITLVTAIAAYAKSMNSDKLVKPSETQKRVEAMITLSDPPGPPDSTNDDEPTPPSPSP